MTTRDRQKSNTKKTHTKQIKNNIWHANETGTQGKRPVTVRQAVGYSLMQVLYIALIFSSLDMVTLSKMCLSFK